MTLDELNAAAASFHWRSDASSADGFRHQEKRRATVQTCAQKALRLNARPRLVHIYNFSFSRITPSRSACFKLACTKRHLCPQRRARSRPENSVAAPTSRHLRRSVSGKFDVADAKPLDENFENCRRANSKKRVIPFLKLSMNA